MIQEVRVASKQNDIRGAQLLHDVQHTLGINSITQIRTAKVYRLQGVDEQTAQDIAQQSLVDPLVEECVCNKRFSFFACKVLEVGNKPGVMNPEVESVCKAAKALGIELVAADASWEYHFCGDLTDKELTLICDRLLVNKTVEQIITKKPTDLQITGTVKDVTEIPLQTMQFKAFKNYAQNQQLFLNALELQTIQDYFKQLGRNPYDGELETIAQTWSEHCSHKTFKAPLVIDGKEKEPLFTRLRATAALFFDDVVSAFADNAGVFKFYDGFAIAGKVETHNSPSAIEPYGGAATGSGGVFRDIMGTGKGAQVIASTDIFCLAPPNLEQEKVPPGCLHPNYLLRNVVAGVRDYGNRMGIPTNNGSVHFHEDFKAKPTVIVGAYGLIPEKYAQQGKPKVNDRIFVVGGKTGRDGIHGATFSSDAMTDKTISVNATAVQIGNPIEQKRTADALLAARDKNLIRAITDCGAGGFSSAVGEMAEEIGAYVQLENAPLKYSGLAPWEVWVSESQERMVCAIAPEDSEQLIELCKLYNVQATDIGYFTGDKQLLVLYNGQTVCNLDMEFLHNGRPDTLLYAHAPQRIQKIDKGIYSTPKDEQDWVDRFKQVLKHGNVCSKEAIVRQYDHTVQGMNVVAPYAGIIQDGPQDATVLTPLYGKKYGLIIAHGLNPILNRIDPYAGSLWAITEALANLVAVGGNPQDVALIDNFIWPKPNGEFLWALDQSMDACVDAMKWFKLPFISGKDSLSSTYNYPDGKQLHIPPVLCISAFGKIPDGTKTITSDIKQEDSLLLLIGQPQFKAMAGSVYEQTLNYESNNVPVNDCQEAALLFEQLHELINSGKVLACHDISEGGMLTTVTEMCFGGKMGATVEIPNKDIRSDHYLFNETAGCFIAEVSQQDYNNGEFDLITHSVLGTTSKEQTITVNYDRKQLFSVSLDALETAYKQPMQEVFGK